MPDNSVPPCMSLMTFNLLSTHWSLDRVNPTKSLFGPFKRNCLRFQQFSTGSNPTAFHSQKLWGLIFLALEPWSGEPIVRLGPLTPEISLLIFIYHMWVWNQPDLCLCPSYRSQWGFFNSVVGFLWFCIVGLPLSLISEGSEWWFFFSLVEIWCGYARRHAMFIYVPILTGSPNMPSILHSYIYK